MADTNTSAFRAKVQLFLQDRHDKDPPIRFEELAALATWAASVHTSISSSQRSNILSREEVSDEAHQLFLCDALHNLSQMTLYSTLVPLFCGSSPEEPVDSLLIRSSASTVVENAWSFANTLRAYCENRQDATYMCPLIGHCAFTAAAVLLAFEVARTRKEPEGLVPTFTSVESMIPTIQVIIETLDELSRYWRVLRRPVSILSPFPSFA